MGRRFFKVLIVVSFLIIVGTIIGCVINAANSNNFGHTLVGNLFAGLIISPIPLIVVLVVQYVVYGSIKPFYIFKDVDN